MTKKGHIAHTLSLVTLGISSIILLLVVGYGHYNTVNGLRNSASAALREYTAARATRLSSTFRAVEQAVNNFGDTITIGRLDNTQTLALMVKYLEKTPELSGLSVAFVAKNTEPRRQAFMPLYYKQNGKIVFADETADQKRQMTMDFLALPQILGRMVWAEPFYAITIPQMMTTCSVPLYIDDELYAIVTGVVYLNGMTTRLAESMRGKAVYPVLISSTGKILSHPNENYVVDETIFSLGLASHEHQLFTIGRRMQREASGLDAFLDPETGTHSLVSFQRIAGVNWSLALVLPESQFVAPIEELTRTQLFFSGGGICVLLLVLSLSIHRILRPISVLNSAIAEISAGRFHTPIPTIKANNEVSSLAEAFTVMQLRLAEIIDELRESTAREERVASEMQIARSIQMGLVPRTFPPFPRSTQIDLFAMLRPAQDVGGDFYDFFSLDEDRIFVTIGDVSGKGVPAALFMAVIRTLIRSLAKNTRSPAELLTTLNSEVVQNNDSAMFVTVFCAEYSLRDGALTYASGGHNPAMLVRRTGEKEWLRESKGVLIGGFENMQFSDATVRLEKGDCLVMYTDGVTEAMNDKGEEFGEARFAACLSEETIVSVTGCINKIDSEVTTFINGAMQSDDITILCLQRMQETDTAATSADCQS